MAGQSERRGKTIKLGQKDGQSSGILGRNLFLLASQPHFDEEARKGR